MFLLSPLSLGFILILFTEVISTRERVVQLRRDKRDVDIVAACDERCLPEDQIKDYDLLLMYDDDKESTPVPGLYETKCAFACKIVDMNKTDESINNLRGEFSVLSVEEVPYEDIAETSTAVHFLSSLVGLRKNVSFSPSISENEKVSNCACSNNSTSTTNESTTPTIKPTGDNNTELKLSKQNSSSLFVEDGQENSTAISDFLEHMLVTNENTTQKPQFSVVPAIPKVIRFTVLEAEMAEAGQTPAPNGEKTQDKGYFDVNNNASLVLKSILENLAQLGVHASKGLESLNPSHATINGSVNDNLNGKVTSKPSLLTTSPSPDVTVTAVKNILDSKDLTESNKINTLQDSTSSNPGNSSTPVGLLTTESLKSPLEDYSQTTPSSITPTSTQTISSATSSTVSSTANHASAHPLVNGSKITETKQNNSNESSSDKESVLIDVFNHTSTNISLVNSSSPVAKENNTTNQDHLSTDNSTTHLVNDTKFEDDVGNITAKHRIENSLNFSNIPDEMKKNVTLSNFPDSKDSSSTEQDVDKLTLDELIYPNISLHNESFGLDGLQFPGIIQNIYGENVNSSNQSSILPQPLQNVVPSTASANVTDFSINNNTTASSYSPSKLHQVINSKNDTINGKTALHKV